jgi:hypothetical protein
MVLAVKSKPSATIHHKKRVGAHHRQTKHYAKPYWPYLPVAFIIAVGILANSSWTHHNTDVLGFATDVSSPALLADTNTDRQASHESSLVLDSDLMKAAQAKANDMAARNYWSHDTPDGKTPWTFMTAAGYKYAAAGENLAYGFTSSNAILNGWMHSPEHRANVLNHTFSQVGFGIADSPDYQGNGPETIVVAMYGEPAGAVLGTAVHTGAVQAADPGVVKTTPAQSGVQPAATRFARVQILTGDTTWVLFMTSAVGAIAAAWFITRHTLAWRRVVVHGEKFIVNHRLLDVMIVSIAMLGFILSRSAGLIR